MRRPGHLFGGAMSVDCISAAWAVIGVTHTAKIVLLALADNANDAGVCWPSIPNIAERCCLDVRSVYRMIASLEGQGHLTTESRPGRSTIYRVHPRMHTPDRESGLPLTESQVTNSHAPMTNSRKPLTHSHPPLTDSRKPLTNGQGESSGTVKEPSGTRESRRASARARSRTVPEDFAITEDMRSWAKEKCPNVDIDAETEKFRDHEFRDPHSNWIAAWRQWMRRCIEFVPRGTNGIEPPKPKRTWRPPDDGVSA